MYIKGIVVCYECVRLFVISLSPCLSLLSGTRRNGHRIPWSCEGDCVRRHILQHKKKIVSKLGVKGYFWKHVRGGRASSSLQAEKDVREGGMPDDGKRERRTEYRSEELG